MKFTIVIPTYKRIKKLQRCINSILKQTHQDFEIIVLCDNRDIETCGFIASNYSGNEKISSFIMKDHLYVMGCWNWFAKNCFDTIKDTMVWIVDDTELYPNCLEELNKSMIKYFPDTDGVIGIAQECPGHPEYTYKPYGQVVLGKKFIERYKEGNYQVSCPDYIFMYQDEEMHQFATSINKFVFCKEAILKHYHPCFVKEEIDETHKISRGKTLQKDTEIYNLRKAKGLIWGKSFELIKEEINE